MLRGRLKVAYRNGWSKDRNQLNAIAPELRSENECLDKLDVPLRRHCCCFLVTLLAFCVSLEPNI